MVQSLGDNSAATGSGPPAAVEGGTTAIPLARAGAEVVEIGIARNLVEAGNRRAGAEAGLTRLKFQEGDACNLEGVADGSLDLTVSIFGAMFAPKPFDVAGVVVRVTKAGGRIVMGNWIPNDPTFVSQVLKISSAFTPPPPEGFVSPMTWGVGNSIIERFGQAGVPKGEHLRRSRTRTTLPSPEKSPAQFMEQFETFYGPTMNAVEGGSEEREGGGTPRPTCGSGEDSARTRVRTPVLLSLPPSCGSLFTFKAKSSALAFSSG